MNLSISPDLDARICYIVVLCCGVVAARVQIYRRLQERKVTGIWVEPGTWLMFLIYLAAPLTLFWLMDRSGAVSDTALFAAILIGASYPAVLSGSFGGLRARRFGGDLEAHRQPGGRRHHVDHPTSRARFPESGIVDRLPDGGRPRFNDGHPPIGKGRADFRRSRR